MVANYEEILKKVDMLEAKHIRLRKFTIEDKEDVLEYGSDEAVLKYLRWNGIKNIEEAEEVITGFYNRPGVYAIERKESQKCIGCIDIRIDYDNDKTRFGYLLNQKYWNQGYMTEALGAIFEFCFKQLQLNRIEAIHFVGNEGSGRVMQKCGMKKEGRGIQAAKAKDKFYDTIYYGIIKKQWIEDQSKIENKG